MYKDAYFLSLKKETPKRGYWDYGLLEDLLDDFKKHEVDSLPKQDFAVVVLPARSHAELIAEFNKEIAKLDKALIFLMGDEESVFPVEQIEHKSAIIWIQNPTPGRHDEYMKLGCGYPPLIHDEEEVPEKSLDWFFSGQITHQRRTGFANQLRNLNNGQLIETPGFTQGVARPQYFELMGKSKVAPCPSGPVTVDTFRTFEALELGCVPIADTQTPSRDMSGFWTWLFGEEPPFVQIKDTHDLPGYINDCLELYPYKNNRVQAWWLRKKQDYKQQIIENISDLTSLNMGELVTAVVPISPIPSHPETHILEETIKSIKHHFPKARIILTFDGVRKEHEHMRADYEEHIRRVLWKSRFWGNIYPVIFDEHTHQVGMMRAIIDYINSPALLYVEQDTPLVTDEEIRWTDLLNPLMAGDSNVIRLHHEGVIPKEHNHLILGVPKNRLLKTIQWSQRPHLASKAFYRRMLKDNFSESAKCFIEDLIHSKVIESYKKDGMDGWNQWKLHIYYPNSNNIKRSYHTDGRAGAEKLDGDQVW